jgi:diguanylate cyclase (GGDEF)-like protein
VLDTAEEPPFEKIVTLVQQILQTPFCAVSLVDEQRQWFKARRGLGVRETPRDISFCTHTIQQTEPFVIRDAARDARFAANPLVTGDPHIRSYAGVPLLMPDGYQIGSLCTIDTRPREFPENEITILENFASLVVDELELRQIASTDQLTGALTRRAWLEGAAAEIKRSQRYGRPLSMAIMDIDRFKTINDTHGHLVGDVVIRSLAELCISTKRESDVFGRFGGEEFVLLMPETDAAEARNLAERVRTRYADAPIQAGVEIWSTISIGIAELRAGGATPDDLMERADKALYAAKNGGRNRTVLAEAPPARLWVAAG